MMQTILLHLLSPLVGALATTWGLGVLCLVVAFLAPAWLPFNRSHLIWAGAALMAGGAFYWWAFRAGEAHMAQLIAAKDQAAIARVDNALKKVRDCNGGLDWNVVTGSCDAK